MGAGKSKRDLELAAAVTAEREREAAEREPSWGRRGAKGSSHILLQGAVWCDSCECQPTGAPHVSRDGLCLSKHP